ncbi:hypothetical protein ACQP2F_11120 [Actinoplanes sp. CA-030573]|uniref:hypothetical protein n=1 Tax=Actinoplanes sp. CA-030573 TaxID=3239898 RepID=UPI003D93A148
MMIRRGVVTYWLIVAVTVGIVAAVKVWPRPLEARRDEAVDLCKAAVDDQAPTDRRKVWHEASLRVGGDRLITVSGAFSTGDAGLRRFACEIEDGRVTSSEVGT